MMRQILSQDFIKHMRVFLLLIVFFSALTLFASEPQPPKQEVLVQFFYQPGCKKCHRIKNLLLPELAETCAGKYRLEMLSTEDKQNYLQLLSFMEKLKVNSNATAHMVINARILLAGDEIEQKLIDTVNTEYLKTVTVNNADDIKQNNASSDILSRRAAGFTRGTVIIAGLIDGINPCVFSTLVFFISLLTVAKVGKRKMLWVGLVYCVSCFITYLAIGFGLFYFIRILEGFNIAGQIINGLLVGVLLFFAAISFVDCFRYHSSHKAQSVMLKLPESISRRIHGVMRRSLTYKVLLPGIFFIGIIVTVLESVCTGQVYIPTLVLIAKDTANLKWVMLLLLYNLMFILPLVVIFIAVYKGVNTPRLIEWSRQNVIFSKFMLGCFFIMLAVLMLWL